MRRPSEKTLSNLLITTFICALASAHDNLIHHLICGGWLVMSPLLCKWFLRTVLSGILVARTLRRIADDHGTSSLLHSYCL